LETAAVHTFPVLPEVVLTPREAFFAEKESRFRLEKLLVLLVLSRWCFILLEFPLLLPGKESRKRALDYVMKRKEEGAEVQGTADPELEFIQVLK